MVYRRLFTHLCLSNGWLAAALVATFASQHAAAADPVQLVLVNHRFQPDHITVAAGERFRIELTNQDDTTDEFESYDMKFEKIVVSGGHIGVFAGPLHPGTYKFFDDYHPDTATGTITAEAR
jgi:hypothetical protein